jgi:hypothetical protein
MAMNVALDAQPVEEQALPDVRSPDDVAFLGPRRVANPIAAAIPTDPGFQVMPQAGDRGRRARSKGFPAPETMYTRSTGAIHRSKALLSQRSELRSHLRLPPEPQVSVPLDWSRPNGEHIELAVIQHLPAHQIAASTKNPGPSNLDARF